MGMSSSQARLLTLTGRMHDIEYKAAKLEAQKLQMANESKRVYNDYLNALDSNKFVCKSMTGDGSLCDMPFTANTIYSYGQFRNQFALSAPNGQMYIPSSLHSTYQATNDLNEFLSANSITSQSVQREIHTPYENPEYIAKVEEYERDCENARNTYENVTIPNWEQTNADIIAQEQADYERDLAAFNANVREWQQRKNTWDAYDGINNTNLDGLSDTQKDALQEWANKYVDVETAKTQLNDRVANFIESGLTQDQIQAQVDALNNDDVYKNSVINKTDKKIQEDFMNSARGCYNKAVEGHNNANVASGQPSCFTHVLGYIIDYVDLYQDSVDQYVSDVQKPFLTNSTSQGKYKYTDVDGNDQILGGSNNSFVKYDFIDLGSTYEGECTTTPIKNPITNRNETKKIHISAIDLNGDGTFQDNEKILNSDDSRYYYDKDGNGTIDADEQAYSDQLYALAKHFESLNSIYREYSQGMLDAELYKIQNTPSRADYSNPKITSTGEELVYTSSNPYTGGFGYSSGMLYTATANGEPNQNVIYIINNQTRQAIKETFASVSERIKTKQAIATTITTEEFNNYSTYQKLTSAYCLDAEGNVTTKTLRQWAIDLYYVYEQWYSAVRSSGYDYTSLEAQKDFSTTLAGDTQAFTFNDVQATIIAFYNAMGMVDVELDETAYINNRNAQKPTYDVPYPSPEPQRSDYDYPKDTNRPELILPELDDYIGGIEKILIRIDTATFQTFTEPNMAQYYVNLWASMDGRDELPPINCEIVHDDATNKDIPIYTVQNYTKCSSTYSTNEQMGTVQNENYIVIPDNMLNDDSWVYNMVSSGYAILQKFDKNQHKFIDTSVAIETDLNEVPDEINLKKAEAKYEADMLRIDRKDRMYDHELAALDNERNAIKQEMETLKTVAKDNVERTFKLFG